MKYPDECPAFEVVSTQYHSACRVGDVVEGHIFYSGGYGLSLGFYPTNYQFQDADWPAMGQRVTNSVLKPLTQAARDMYAAVMS